VCGTPTDAPRFLNTLSRSSPRLSFAVGFLGFRSPAREVTGVEWVRTYTVVCASVGPPPLRPSAPRTPPRAPLPRPRRAHRLRRTRRFRRSHPRGPCGLYPSSLAVHCCPPAARVLTHLSSSLTPPSEQTHPQHIRFTPRCPSVVLWTPCSGVEWGVLEPTIRVWRSGTTRNQPANLAVESAEESLSIISDYTPTVRPPPKRC
jgi:hypothetical protein